MLDQVSDVPASEVARTERGYSKRQAGVLLLICTSRLYCAAVSWIQYRIEEVLIDFLFLFFGRSTTLAHLHIRWPDGGPLTRCLAEHVNRASFHSNRSMHGSPRPVPLR